MVEQHYDEGWWECHGDAQEAAMRRDLIEKIYALRGNAEKIYELASERWDSQKQPFSTNDAMKWCDISVQNARKHVRVMESRGILWQCEVMVTPGKYLPLYIPAEHKAEYIDAKRQRLVTKGITGILTGTPVKSAKPIAAQPKESLEPDERPYVRSAPLSEPIPEVPGVPKVLEVHKVPEVNVYGQETPRPQMQAELTDGTPVVITGPGNEQGFWKYQKLGQANGVIREGRWMIDLLPSGTFHPPGTPL
jgi:hypothetical protein